MIERELEDRAVHQPDVEVVRVDHMEAPDEAFGLQLKLLDLIRDYRDAGFVRQAVLVLFGSALRGEDLAHRSVPALQRDW